MKRYYYEQHIRKVHESDKDKSSGTEFICKHQYYLVILTFLLKFPLLNPGEYCGQSFFNQVRYTYHVQSRHTKDKPYKCQYCSTSFCTQGSYKNHLKNQHQNIEATCQICSKVTFCFLKFFNQSTNFLFFLF